MVSIQTRAGIEVHMQKAATVCYGLWESYSASGDKSVCGSSSGSGATLTIQNSGYDLLEQW